MLIFKSTQFVCGSPPPVFIPPIYSICIRGERRNNMRSTLFHLLLSLYCCSSSISWWIQDRQQHLGFIDSLPKSDFIFYIFKRRRINCRLNIFFWESDTMFGVLEQGVWKLGAFCTAEKIKTHFLCLFEVKYSMSKGCN